MLHKLKFLKWVIFLAQFQAILLAQPSEDFNRLREKILIAFSQFEYENTLLLIETAKALPTLASVDRLFLLEYQSYTLLNIGQVDSAQSVFSQLLSQDPDYRLDARVASPKILQIFEDIRAQAQRKTQLTHVKFEDCHTRIRNAYLKTLILPGWGHLSRGQRWKGSAILTSFAVTLGSAVYLDNRTRAARKDYLSARDPDRIRTTYDQYNQYYRYRNAAWITAGTVWLLSQFDLIFLPPSAGRREAMQFFPRLDGDSRCFCLAIAF